MRKILQFLTRDEGPSTRVLTFASLFSRLQLMASAYFSFVILMFFWTQGRLPFQAMDRTEEWVEHFYMVMILAVCAITIWVHWRRIRGVRNDPFLKRPRLRIGAVSLFFFILIISLIRMQMLHIWSDEYYQMEDTAHWGPLRGSMVQHQAPLSYILTYGGYLLFGPSDVAIRFHTAVISAFTFLCFYFLLFQIMRRSALALFISVIISFSYYISIYSFEARPQSFGFLFLVFYFFELIRYDQLKREKWLDHAGLILSGLLFLFSLGFQPPFLLAAMTAVYGGVSLLRGRLIKFLKVAGLSVASVLLFLPYQIATAQISPPRIQNMSISSLFDTLLHLELPSLVQLGVVRTSFGAFSLTVAFITIFSFILIRRFLASNAKQTELKARYGAIAVFSTVLFCLVSHTFFNQHIQWHFYYKYIYLAIPMFFIALACTVSILTGIGPKMSRPWLIRVVGWGVSLFLVSQIQVNGFATVQRHWHYFDVQGVDRLIHQRVSEDGLVIAINNSGEKKVYAFEHYYSYKRAPHTSFKYVDMGNYSEKDIQRLVPDRREFTLVLNMDGRQIDDVVRGVQDFAPIWYRRVASGLVITFSSPGPDNRELIDVLMKLRTIYQNWGWETQSLERFVQNYQDAMAKSESAARR